MAAVSPRPQITPIDRFGLTMCLAIIVHAIIILGITFVPEDILPPRYNTMEIILVQQKNEQEPDDAKVLAQANLEGGGDIEEAVNPATPMPAPFPEQKPELTAPPPMEATPPKPVAPLAPEAPEPEPEPVAVKETLVAETETPTQTKPEPVKKAEPKQEKPKPVQKVQEVKPEQPVVKKEETLQEEKPRTKPSAAALLTNSFKIASLSAEIRRKMEAKSQRPRRKFISASTKEFRYATYMEAWRAKVERVGNLNYPDEARRRKLSGSLILDVALNADGSINQITVRRSSGHKVLDDAAIRIVELASPFAPFPDHIRKETDLLHITRTWQFLNNRGFR